MEILTNQVSANCNFVDEGNVYILGEFNDTISMNVIPKLVTLIAKKSLEKNPQINIFINSYGGEAKALYGLLCLLQDAKDQGIKIVTIVMGRACSCGSMLAVMGDERLMYRHALHLAHLGQDFACVSTNAQVDKVAKKFKFAFKQVLEHYHACTGCPKKTLEKILHDDESWLDPEECLKLGFATHII